MNPWTDAAKAELQRYFARVRPTLAASGADPDEVIEDLKRHLDAEVQSAKLPVVTEEDVRRLLARIGAPESGVSEPISPATPVTSRAPEPAATKAGFWLLFAGVLLPAGTLLFEITSGACAGAFFDPLPTWWHALLVALVPLANGLVWSAVRRNDASRHRLLGWLNGAAVGVAIFYSILFAPLMLPGILGAIFLMGLLPLSPSLALVAGLLLRKKLRQLAGDGGTALPGLGRAIALTFALLLVVEAPVILTRMGTHKAVSDEPAEQMTGLSWLRAVGQEETLLRACYGHTARAQSSDLMGWLIAGERRVTPEQARALYFRVTGRPFNSVPAPNVRTGRGAWAELNDWTWDEDHGGERVGGRLRGLFLESSRLDTVINAEAAWSYTEWTMEFRNDATQQREARAQILLPPGGVVSRLTLWVNGEEREAAFAGRAQTREAYQKVAIRERRDPVLVTTSGPDRVMMQCFPVPADGGLMKIRIGITAPLVLETATEGVTRMPILLERNFTLRKGFLHSVWAQSTHELKSANPKLAIEPSYAGHIALRGQCSAEDLASPSASLRVTRPVGQFLAWTKGRGNPGDHFIRQTIVAEAVVSPARVIFVVDGSVGMLPHWRGLAEVIGRVPVTFASTILIASDVVETVAASELARWRPRGGQDNLPALLEAWNLAVRQTNAVIVWVHGPQPTKLESATALLHAAERTPFPPVIYEIQTEPGPDRILEQLDNLRSIRSVVRAGTLAEDLQRLIASWQSAENRWQIWRKEVAMAETAAAGGAVEGRCTSPDSGRTTKSVA